MVAKLSNNGQRKLFAKLMRQRREPRREQALLQAMKQGQGNGFLTLRILLARRIL